MSYGTPDPNGATNQSINNSSSFTGIAGITAINQNTGVGASQQAAITLSVTTGDVTF